MDTDLIKRAKNDAKSYFNGQHGSHGWDHTERVLHLCKHIGKIEGANIEVLALAAIFHDICKPEEMQTRGAICHATKAAQIAKKILAGYSLPDDTINAIIHCIETHRNRTDKKRQSLEAKILFDSDKLDAIGAVGLGRLFMSAAEIKAKLHNDKGTIIENTKDYSEDDTAYREFYLIQRKLTEKMYTVEGKRIAKERIQFMENFFSRLNQEIDGEL